MSLTPEEIKVPEESKTLEQSKTPKVPNWEGEFARLNRSYEYHLSFGLQAVAFFYAAVGGVLSLYFGGSGGGGGRSRLAITVLLIIPVCMSWILGYFLLRGACLQRADAKYMGKVADHLPIKRPPQVQLLSSLLYWFSALFFLTSVGLIALLLEVYGIININ
jgi:hypothetical protein